MAAIHNQHLYVRECKHSPSYKEGIHRFFVFLLHGSSLYDTNSDTAHCAKCGALLYVPKVYYQTIMHAIYLLAASLLCLLGIHFASCLINSYDWGFLPCFLLVFLFYFTSWLAFDRVTKSIVFSFCAWQAAKTNPTNEEAFYESCKNECKIQRIQRASTLWKGCFLVISVVSFVQLTYFLAVLAVFLLVKYIIARRKLLWPISLFAFSVFASLYVLHFPSSGLALMIEWISAGIFGFISLF